jgi:hypothetical protein
MMRFIRGFLLIALLTGFAPAQTRGDDSFAEPVKKVEKFTGTRTDTFRDNNGDGLNDIRKSDGEKTSPLKGFLDVIIDRISPDTERDDETKPVTPSPSKPKTRTKTSEAEKSPTNPETKSTRSNSKSR